MDNVVVARLGKPHGLKGELTVQLHIDVPQERFVSGASFVTDPASVGPLILRTHRVHNGIHLLNFEQATDRTKAEALRGTRLLIGAGEGDAWYTKNYIGLGVFHVNGQRLGEVVDFHDRPMQDLLEVCLENGCTAYVPFVEQIVLELEAGRIVIDPPVGLLDLARE